MQIYYLGGPKHGTASIHGNPPMIERVIVRNDNETMGRLPRSGEHYQRDNYRFTQGTYYLVHCRNEHGPFGVYVFEGEKTEADVTAFIRGGCRFEPVEQPKRLVKSLGQATADALAEYDRRQPKFTDVLEALLVAEYSKTPEEAAAMVKAHPRIVVNGIMAWNVRATAMALAEPLRAAP